MIDKTAPHLYNKDNRNGVSRRGRAMQQFDPDLLRRAKQGEEPAVAAVIARMMPLLRKGAAANTAPGLDFEDAVQEGLIGLFGAIRRYDAARCPAFAAFAAACITHAQSDARRAAGRKKHAPLNESVPLLPGMPDTTAQDPRDPAELAIASEQVGDVLQKVSSALSGLERTALLQNLAGYSVAQTARAVNRSPKTVENALNRARRKLRANP